MGTIEAKKAGATLLGVEWQTERYVRGFDELAAERPVAHWEPLPLPFHYLSTGVETLFTNLRDPIASTGRFPFPSPRDPDRMVQEEFSLFGRIRRMPPVDPNGLRAVQVGAVEASRTPFGTRSRGR